MAGRRTFFFEGLGVSQGIAIGPAYIVETQDYSSDQREIEDDTIEEEVARFKEAVQLAKDEVASIGRRVAEEIDRQQAAIFDAHLMILEDPAIIETTVANIKRRKLNAESVLWAVTQDLGEQMQSIGDDYFSERNHDLYDVSRRIIKFLKQLNPTHQGEMPQDGCIVVANDLGPGETAQFSRDKVLGFCTNEGCTTGHAAIMAKALSIPAVVGLEFVTHYIRSNDMLILDGSEGKLILNPTKEQIEHYRKKADDLEHVRQALDELRDLPAETTDGVQISMYANIELPEEVENVHKFGGEGIGLFRTEFLYLDRQTLPIEEDHLREYKAVLEGMEGKHVTLRTIDIGGDKLPDRDAMIPELNPFMGVRGIRLSLARPEMFRVQLRAILLAAAGRDVSIMIPMVSTLKEIRTSKRILQSLQKTLKEKGHELPTRVWFGAMVEIPSVAMISSALSEEVDFLSIGTNDLVQYTLAVDRVNKTVAHLYRQTHPAVFRLIKMVVDGAAPTKTPVSVCGEMASDPRLAVVLAGMGIRVLSMGPASIGAVKSAIRNTAISDAESLAHQVLQKGTADEVDELLDIHFGEAHSPLSTPA